jgi:HD-like signal output (HDOD) protein/CheY-like chemotaxis protein
MTAPLTRRGVTEGAQFESTTQASASRSKRRILFVDDEVSVLEGLRAVLRAQRHEWDMVFALGGVRATELLQSQTFDVVVTDMRMPVVDGAEVLQRAKQLQPHAVRIVLSGQTDVETAMKSVFSAHQFLAKPCEVKQLRAAVQRACGLNELVSSEELRSLAGDVSFLPSPPKTYLAISRAVANQSCTTGEVAAIVEREPALCAKVLQVINSAFFGLPRSVSSVAQAINYLGTLTLKNLALAMETMQASRGAQLPLTSPELLAFQTNSLLVGLLGRHWYAGDRRRADEAFVAGMLRDMGHWLLAVRTPTPVEAPDCHAALSAYLLGLWGIPHAVLEPVAFHERPDLVEHGELEVVDVVHMADRIAAELVPSPFQRDVEPLDASRLEQLGVTAERLQQFRDDARDLLGHARELLKS